MVIALLADIHGNREALSACLTHARARGAEKFVFLGDYVGYGADPDYAVVCVAEHVARGALVQRTAHPIRFHIGNQFNIPAPWPVGGLVRESGRGVFQVVSQDGESE